MADSHADIDKHVRVYLTVFGCLAVLTVATWWVAYLELGHALAIAVALLIATVKASLVACYFMHLISEKRFIFLVLTFTVIFFVGLLLLPLFAAMDIIRY
jgi:cytochrome c oxidase subunit 4